MIFLNPEPSQRETAESLKTSFVIENVAICSVLILYKESTEWRTRKTSMKTVEFYDQDISLRISIEPDNDKPIRIRAQIT